MTSLLRHDYLKTALEERLNRNAEEIVLTRALPAKENITKASELRSQSVARSIKKSDYESQIEHLKLQKAHQGTLSFSEIEKNLFKYRKELSLPPISHSPSGSKSFQPSEVQSSTTRHSPAKLTIKKDDIIDEIHNLRLKAQAIEERSHDKQLIKIGVTKKERQEILNQYYNAKKQLSSVK